MNEYLLERLNETNRTLQWDDKSGGVPDRVMFREILKNQKAIMLAINILLEEKQ